MPCGSHRLRTMRRTELEVSVSVDRAALVAIADMVASRTAACPTTIWGFGVGGALSALGRAAVALDQPALVDDVATRVSPSLHRAADPTDHLIAVDALLALAGVRPELDVTSACARWRDSVVPARRP